MSDTPNDGGSACPSDTEMVDWLEGQLQQKRYSGKAICRVAVNRGIRLHETTREGAVPSIRLAIYHAMKENTTDER